MTTPRIYVGTYGAYNSGSLHGGWLDLDDYSDKDEFMQAVNELHAKELAARGEIEPMFQDWEGIPDRFIGESHLSEDVWAEWVELSDEQREVLELYLDNVNQGGTLEEAEEAFQGTFSSPEDWAQGHLEDSGALENVPDDLKGYIDFAAWARDARHDWVDFVQHQGETWVFRTDC